MFTEVFWFSPKTFVIQMCLQPLNNMMSVWPCIVDDM